MGSVDVRAAGGVLWRGAGDETGDETGQDPDEVEVLLVHRPKYDDWTFPKGKLDDGESWRDAAVREVVEETGYEVVVGAKLAKTDYDDHKGRHKRVRYWAMTVEAGVFVANDEVDAARWCGPEAARELLTYGHDVEVLEALLSARHADELV